MAELQDTTINSIVSVETGSENTPTITTINDTDTGLFFSSANKIDFTTNGNSRFSIDNNGYVIFPYQPAFSVNNSETGNRINRNTDIDEFDATTVDRGGHFNKSNGRFTAPVDGVYWFSWWAQEETYYGNWGNFGGRFYKNGNLYNNFGRGSVSDATSENWIIIQALIPLNTNDYVTIRFNSSDATPSFENDSGNFSGWLIG